MHYTATRGKLQVTEHCLTLRPTRDQVTVERQPECTTIDSFLQCEGELSGNYTWSQENTETNYVLFNLNQRAVVAQVNLMYMVAQGSQTPKVSFCAAAGNSCINNTFSGLECMEIAIEATGMTETGTLNTPFINETSNVVMEIITTGIKADFVATRIELYGNSTVTGIGTHSFHAVIQRLYDLTPRLIS